MSWLSVGWALKNWSVRHVVRSKDSVNEDGMRTQQRERRMRRDNEERPWIGVRWMCCNVYTRVTRDPEVKMYLGRCPKCLKSLKIRVAPGGSDCRMFVAR